MATTGFPVSPGTGTTSSVAVDIVNNFLFQKNKLAFGIDGAAIDVTVSTPLPVLMMGMPATLGAKPGSQSMSVVFASDQSTKTSAPVATSVGMVSVQTSTLGGLTYVPFAAKACNSLTIVNDTGISIDIFRTGDPLPYPVLATQTHVFLGITDASNLSVRRTDQSPTQITVTAEAITA